MPKVSLENLTNWLVDVSVRFGLAGIRIAAIIMVGIVVAWFLRKGIKRLETAWGSTGEVQEPFGVTRQRVVTLTGLVRTIALTLIWGIVVIISLEQLGLDIRPILAGAGLLGLAIGFGAQNLVRDLISGFFLILEDQVRIGDVAVVNGTGGLVEDITFRTITLRDVDGVVHMFPNGTITTLSNMTKEWSAYVVDVRISYGEDPDRVMETMRQVAEELQKDHDFGEKVLAPIEIFGVDAFQDMGMVIKARLKTKPMEQWTVGREYRRRLKKAFDAQGIHMPTAFAVAGTTFGAPKEVQAKKADL